MTPPTNGAWLPLISPTGACSQSDPPSTDLILEYKGFTIVVRKEFAAYADLLQKNQQLAVDRNVVCDVARATKVDMFGFTSESPPRACVHLNLRPIARKLLQYCWISLFERDNLVVAGLVLVSLREAFAFPDDTRHQLGLASTYALLLKK